MLTISLGEVGDMGRVLIHTEAMPIFFDFNVFGEFQNKTIEYCFWVCRSLWIFLGGQSLAPQLCFADTKYIQATTNLAFHLNETSKDKLSII